MDIIILSRNCITFVVPHLTKLRRVVDG